MLPRDDVALTSGLRCAATGIPITKSANAHPAALGARRAFWVGDPDVSRMRQITATLRLTTTHLQMWVEEGPAVAQESLERSSAFFEQRSYPAVYGAFGDSASIFPGGGPHLLVLNARVTGAAGYYSSANQYPRSAVLRSNEQAMFVMNIGNLTPGETGYDAVLAHEFQHMLHWHLDRNEDAWFNEGVSELAEELAGFPSHQDTIAAYEEMPDLSLTDWRDDDTVMAAQYGASYLMARYFSERFGAEMFRDLVQSPSNGMDSFEAILIAQSPGAGFDALFADWSVANAVDDPDALDGRYGYRDLSVSVGNRQQVIGYPRHYDRQVHQYGSDYYELARWSGAPLGIAFGGAPEARVLPTAPTSGEFMWWSNRGDGSHAYLQRSFDLTDVKGATLEFSVWHDIEPGWDYAYIRISTDGGKTWDLLDGVRMQPYDPEGNALGPGYTGRSGGQNSDGAQNGDGAQNEGTAADSAEWVQESIDLGPWCGHKVTLRFEYVTDDAINHAGLCLDDVGIEAIGFLDDVERGEEDWETRGFLRHDNQLPQRFSVQLVTVGDEVSVRSLWVDQSGRGAMTVAPPAEAAARILLIVSAITPITTELADYSLRFEQVSKPRNECW